MKASEFLKGAEEGDRLFQEEYSISKLRLAAKCWRKAYYRYVLGKKENPVFFVKGRAVHLGQEVDNRAKIKGRSLSVQQILDVSVDGLKEEKKNLGIALDIDSFVSEHREQLAIYEESGLRQQVQPVEGTVEGFFTINLVVDEVPAKIQGFVDVVSEVVTDRIVKEVVDYKRVVRPVSAREAQNDLQFSLYQWGSGADRVRVVNFISGEARQKLGVKSQDCGDFTEERREKLLGFLARTIQAFRTCVSTGFWPRCEPSCYWCSPKACDYFKECYPKIDKELKTIVQVGDLAPVGTLPVPAWRKEHGVE